MPGLIGRLRLLGRSGFPTETVSAAALYIVSCMVTPSNKIKQSLKLSNKSCVINGMGDRLAL